MVDELENREHDYQTKTDGLTSQVKELSDTIASFREQLENEQSLRKKTSETYEENRQEWSNIIAQYSQDKIDLESDIAKANEDLQQAKNEAADLQEQLKNAQSFDREALEDRYVEATGRAEGLQNQVNNLIKEIKDLKSKNGSIQDKLSSAEMLLKNISLPNKESTLQQSLERVRQLEVEIMGYKRAIENSNKESEEATKKHEQHVAESRRIIEKTFAELEQRNTEIKNMKEMLEKENQKHKEQNDQLENNCKSLTEEKEGLVSEMASLKSKLGEMESEMVGLKDTAAQCTEENAKAQSQLEERVRLNSQNEKVIEELKVKLSNVEKKLDEAVMYGQKLDEFTDATKSSYELRAQQWEEALGELGHEYRKYNSDIQTLLNNIKQENSDSEESISIANLRTLSESLLSTKNGLEQMLYTKSTLLDHTQQLLQEKTITADKLENHNKILCEDNQKLRSQINHLTTLKEELATSKAAIEILQEENNRLIKSQETIQANLSAKSKELGDMTSKLISL
jgi:chromosome segregation ATPase